MTSYLSYLYFYMRAFSTHRSMVSQPIHMAKWEVNVPGSKPQPMKNETTLS